MNFTVELLINFWLYSFVALVVIIYMNMFIIMSKYNRFSDHEKIEYKKTLNAIQEISQQPNITRLKRMRFIITILFPISAVGTNLIFLGALLSTSGFFGLLKSIRLRESFQIVPIINFKFIEINK